MSIALKKAGFQIWNMGGGCTALGKELANGLHVLVTDLGGCNSPTKEALVGLRNSNGDEIACVEFDVYEASEVLSLVKTWATS